MDRVQWQNCSKRCLWSEGVNEFSGKHIPLLEKETFAQESFE
jgi:hypothetical protein